MPTLSCSIAVRGILYGEIVGTHKEIEDSIEEIGQEISDGLVELEDLL